MLNTRLALYRLFILDVITFYFFQWGLVCENKWMHATASSVYMAGMMVGVLSSGAISDR